MGNGPKQILFERGHKEGHETYENMLKVTNFLRDANQNDNVVPFHTCQNGYYNKSTNDKCWRGCREKGTLVHCWWECRLVQPLWRIVWSFLKKLKMELPFDPVIPLLGIYPRKLETPIRKDICNPMFIAAQFKIAKIWKQPKCLSADEWIKKLVHVHNGILRCYK